MSRRNDKVKGSGNEDFRYKKNSYNKFKPNRNIIFKHPVGSKVQRVRRADNLIIICEPIVWTMWDP
jgi:hypothetical protein